MHNCKYTNVLTHVGAQMHRGTTCDPPEVRTQTGTLANMSIGKVGRQDERVRGKGDVMSAWCSGVRCGVG